MARKLKETGRALMVTPVDQTLDLSSLDRDLGKAARTASGAVLTQMVEVAGSLRTAAKMLTRVVPQDLRTDLRLPQSRIFLQGLGHEGNQDMVARFVVRSDAVAELSNGLLEYMGLSLDQQEGLMAAIAAGNLLADEGDDNFLGRLAKRRAQKMTTLAAMDLPPAYYELSRVPGIRQVFQYAQYLAKTWVEVYQASRRHYQTYVEVRGTQDGLMAVAKDSNAARLELLDRKRKGLDEMGMYEPEVNRIGTILTTEHNQLSDEQILALSEEYLRYGTAHQLASIDAAKAALDEIDGVLLEIQARTGASSADRRSWAILRQVAQERLLATVCAMGVMTSVQAVSDMMIAAANAMREVQIRGIMGSKYDPSEDTFLQDSIAGVQAIIARYQQLVSKGEKMLADPLRGVDVPAMGKEIEGTLPKTTVMRK